MDILPALFGLACLATIAFAVRSGDEMAMFLAVALTAMWAASNIVTRKAQESSTGFDPLALVVWGSLVPIVPFLLLSLWLDPVERRWTWLDAHWSSWLGAAFLGWVATAGAYGMWTGLLKRYPANRVAPFSLGVPVVGLTAGMLVLGESINGWQAAGIALVVAALACVMFGPALAGAWRRLRSRPRSS